MTSLFADIVHAHYALRPQVKTTSLDYSVGLSQLTGCEVYLKAEHAQHTGSFKFRGVSNKLRLLSQEERARGVIAASSGNHGLALAWAGRDAGIPVTVYAPQNASVLKLEAIRDCGAQLELVEGDTLAAELAAGEAARAQGLPFISPYNDVQVIAGQGTVGMELAEQMPDLDAVFVAVGGGGLISGIATALEVLAPHVEMVGCWPANAPTMYESLKAGHIVQIVETDTLSDGTAGGVEPGAITFPLCQQLIDQCVLVSEQEIARAMRTLAQTDRRMVEGAAAVALASLIQCAAQYQGRKVAVVLCGHNIVLEKFLEAIR